MNSQKYIFLNTTIYGEQKLIIKTKKNIL